MLWGDNDRVAGVPGSLGHGVFCQCGDALRWVARAHAALLSASDLTVTVELGLSVALDYSALSGSAAAWLIVPVVGLRMTLDAGTALAQSGVQEVDSPTKTRTAAYP